jgi:hypothetical protein
MPKRWRTPRSLGAVVALVAVSLTVLPPPSAAVATTPPETGYGAADLVAADGWVLGTTVADVTGDGKDDLVVTQMLPGDQPEVAVYKQLNAGALAASPATYVPSVIDPGGARLVLAVGDVDTDGKNDVAVGTDHGVDLFTQSSGVLTGPTTLVTGAEVYGLRLADLNGDGRDDVIYTVDTTGHADFAIYRRLQLAGGGFGAQTKIATISGGEQTFEVGDITLDGRPDIVLTNGGAAVITILVHDAVGQGFTETTEDRLGPPARAASIADVTNDGINDLVVADSYEIAYFKGRADGTLRAPIPLISNFGYPFAVSAADMNGDGLADVVGAEGTDTEIFPQGPDGPIAARCSSAAVNLTDNPSNATVGIGDLNGDGRPDLAGADPYGGGVRVSYGLAPAATASTLTVTPQPSSITVGTTVGISIDLSLEVGGCIAAVPVKVFERTPNGDVSLLDSTALTFNGSPTTWWAFEEATPPTKGAYSFKATWAGDAYHASANSGWQDLPVANNITNLSLGAQPNDVYVDQGTTLYANMWPYPDPPGDIAFYAHSDSGDTLLGTVAADANGQASLPIPAAGIEGTSAYVATWAGNDTWDPATSGVATVRSSRHPTHLHLSASHPKVRYGDTVTLTAKLGASDPSLRKVTFFQMRSGNEVPISTETVDAQGLASIRVAPTKNTTYGVRYAGTGLWSAATDLAKEYVQVIVTGKMIKASSWDKDTAVYACCRAHYTTKVRPDHGGKRVIVEVWVYAKGWHSLGRLRFALAPNSTRTIYIDIKNGGGYRFRVQSTFPNDQDHVGASSSFDYFRFTGSRTRASRSAGTSVSLAAAGVLKPAGRASPAA